ncbi:MAG: biotin/lipoyl-binding protein, partial [Elusimicrobiaceae bacterium]|nr:biotin/lipoyl-binding protein [Elusimicrobiaceae bacterium]
MKQLLIKLKDICAGIWHKFWAMSRWKKIIALVVLLGVAWFLKGCFIHSRPVPQFRIVPVKRGDIVDMVEASGPINPVNTTQVGALVSGEILKIYVDYNSEVKKGDLMAVIDQTQILAQLAEARASLSSAKENLESAEVSYRLAKKN